MAKKTSTKNPKVETVEENINTPVEIIQKEDNSIEGSIQEENNTTKESTIEKNNTSTSETTVKKEKEEEQTKEKSNVYKVKSIIQKRPSYYNLLLENGEKVVVSKDQFNRIEMEVTL